MLAQACSIKVLMALAIKTKASLRLTRRNFILLYKIKSLGLNTSSYTELKVWGLTVERFVILQCILNPTLLWALGKGDVS